MLNTRFKISDVLSEACTTMTTAYHKVSYYLEKLASIKMADPKSDWDEGTRISMIIEGLEQERRKFVDLRNPRDLNELREAISRADAYAINNFTLGLQNEFRELKDLFLSFLDKQSSSSS